MVMLYGPSYRGMYIVGEVTDCKSLCCMVLHIEIMKIDSIVIWHVPRKVSMLCSDILQHFSKLLITSLLSSRCCL